LFNISVLLCGNKSTDGVPGQRRPLRGSSGVKRGEVTIVVQIFIMRNFKICTLHQILLGLSNQGRLCEWDMGNKVFI